MKKMNMEIEIDASNEKVWASIVDVNFYRLWAKEFMEGSYFEGGWNKGDTIQFLAVNESGSKEGMVSEIAESDYPKFISIRHLGYIMDGVIDTTSDMVKAWSPSYENYTLEALGDQKTKFKLDMDVEDQYYDMMLEMWQRAMLKMKQVSER
jgi:hypothetical protein